MVEPNWPHNVTYPFKA